MTNPFRLWGLAGSVLSICLLARPSALGDDIGARIAGLFESYDGCFILYDVKKGKEVFTHNRKRCEERHPACSTFKVALAAAAFDSGVLKNENEPFKWDGTRSSIDSWNKDHTASTWMKDSVVWVSQQITPRVGKDRLTEYMKKCNCSA